MDIVPEKLRSHFAEHNQEHVFRSWPQLSGRQRQQLLKQLQDVDLAQLRELFLNREELAKPPALESIQPIPSVRLHSSDESKKKLGEDALRRGEVAVLIVAGGQGTRLGCDDPKGMFSIGTVSGKSLFQILGEKVLALRRRYKQSIPLLIMTSPATDHRTREFFTEKSFFGLPADEVRFFCQGSMPALDLRTGALLMKSEHELCLSPNGHGGVLPALRDERLLDLLHDWSIQHLFYCQVDNPLVKIADPVFLGHHIQQQAEASTKAIPKQQPNERVGNLALVDGKCSIIEYSDLPDELAFAQDERGQLRFGLGNTAIHLFTLEFLQRMSADKSSLPFHAAKKKVAHVGPDGAIVEPASENGCKFEMFVFDILPRAQRWSIVEIEVEEEYAPLKNKEGANSPDDVRQAMSRLAEIWLVRAGVRLPPASDPLRIEISPLFALDADELAAKVNSEDEFTEPVYLA